MVDMILLTEQWLKDFGFTEIDDGFENGIRIEYEPQQDCYWLEPNTLQSSPIIFVHQLQNLHFVLVGKELTKK